MADHLTTNDLERMAFAELDAAAVAEDREEKRLHLDQAAIYAAMSERQRDAQAMAIEPAV